MPSFLRDAAGRRPGRDPRPRCPPPGGPAPGAAGGDDRGRRPGRLPADGKARRGLLPGRDRVGGRDAAPRPRAPAAGDDGARPAAGGGARALALPLHRAGRAGSFVLVAADRSVARAAKPERWATICREAAMLAGRLVVPEVTGPGRPRGPSRPTDGRRPRVNRRAPPGGAAGAACGDARDRPGRRLVAGREGGSPVSGRRAWAVGTCEPTPRPSPPWRRFSPPPPTSKAMAAAGGRRRRSRVGGRGRRDSVSSVVEPQPGSTFGNELVTARRGRRSVNSEPWAVLDSSRSSDPPWRRASSREM